MLDELFQGDALWFSAPALLGTLVFVLRLGLMLIGGDSGDGGDVGGDVGGDLGDFDLDDHPSSDTAFTILSVQSIAVFLMGFGWVGLGCVLGAGWPLPVGIGLGFLAGVAMIWILARTLGAVRELESSGNIKLHRTLGLEGDVYAQVPAAGSGRGQVRLVIDRRQRIYNAVSGDAEIASQTRVRVVNVNDDNTLTVEPV